MQPRLLNGQSGWERFTNSMYCGEIVFFAGAQQLLGLFFKVRKVRNFGKLFHVASMRGHADGPQSGCIKAFNLW